MAECFGLIFRDDAAEFTNWKFGVSAYSQVNTVIYIL